MAKVRKQAESKAQRFERIAERRVNTVVKVLRLIGNLANRGNYEYSESHVQQIFNALDQELRSAKSRFRNDDDGSSKQFKFGGRH